MRVRASLLPLAALSAFALANTASGSATTPPEAGGAGIKPAAASVVAALVRVAGAPAEVPPADALRASGRRAEPPPPRPRPHRLAIVRGSVALSDRPGGRASLSIDSSTEFGSPRVLGVAARRDGWLGVVTTEQPNNRLAWMRAGSSAVKLRRTRWSLHADLSARTLTLRKEGRRVHRLAVAVGRPGSETPTGRFAVTDKLDGTRFSPYYGCCVLALTGKQPNTPPGWTGGNRLAIHGTSDPSTIGAAASAGCLRAADADLRVLMSKVPLGTPVFIRS